MRSLSLFSLISFSCCSLNAAPVLVEVSSATEFTYSADVSGSDLLNGLVATTVGWDTRNNASPTELNDGVHGVGFAEIAGDLVQGAWTTVGATAEYDLGVGAHGNGYDLTSLTSIADWSGVGFGNQVWTLEVRSAGGAYLTLAEIDYQPLAGGAGSTKVTLTDDDTGILASGIQFVRITAGQQAGHSSGAFVWREFDLFGDPTPNGPDITPPAIVSFTPTLGATDVSTTRELQATFNEALVIGAGNLIVKNLDTGVDVTLAMSDSQISLLGNNLIINLDDELAFEANYSVRIDPGAVTDMAGNSFAGITDDSTWAFQTRSDALRIMCVGDSVTAGYTDNPTWSSAHAFMFGYRSGLYERLIEAGYDFKFVGSSPEPFNNMFGDPTNGGTYTPALDLRDLGQDGHRGYGGNAIFSDLDTFIMEDDPDVILLMIGINGISAASPAALDNLVANIVSEAPDAHLVVAQITPRATFNQALYDFNLHIRDTLVPSYVANGFKVSTVDQYSLFLTTPASYTTTPSTPSAIAPGLHSNNINHPTNALYDQMAQRWFEAVDALGLGPDFESWISNPEFGLLPAEQGFDLDPDADGIPNGIEAFMGTHPSEFNSAFSFLKIGDSASFSYPVNPISLTGITASVEWSPDLQNWYLSGEGPSEEEIVTLTPSVTGNTTEVDVSASAGQAAVFIRLAVTLD